MAPRMLSHPQLLAEGKFDIAATDGHGYTAAFWAIQHGHLNTLDVLRAGGAKLDLTSLGGMSMLATAAYHGYVEICVYASTTAIFGRMF